MPEYSTGLSHLAIFGPMKITNQAALAPQSHHQVYAKPISPTISKPECIRETLTVVWWEFHVFHTLLTFVKTSLEDTQTIQF